MLISIWELLNVFWDNFQKWVESKEENNGRMKMDFCV